MVIRLFAAGLVAGSLFTGAATATTTVYIDRTAFLAAISGATTDAFVEPTSYYPLTEYGALYPGTTFSIASSNQYLGVTAPRLGNEWNWNSGAVLDVNTGSLTVSVAAGITAIGFDLGDYYYNPGYLYVDGGFYLTKIKPDFLFIGLTSDTALAAFNVYFGGGYGVIDNVTTGVALPRALPAASLTPEPGSWAMMIVGFGLVGSVARGRRMRVAG